MEKTADEKTSQETVSFDRAVWVANKGVRDDTNARRPMIESAMAKLSNGMTFDQVKKILGEPDSQSEKRWAYVVGQRALFTNEVEILVVLFTDGKVTKFAWSASG